MQSASSRISTRVAVSISYDDNHYTTGTSNGNNLFIVSNQFQKCLQLTIREQKISV